MSAITINLTDISFPSTSTIELNSAYGGIDGKYQTLDHPNMVESILLIISDTVKF